MFKKRLLGCAVKSSVPILHNKDQRVQHTTPFLFLGRYFWV